MVSRSALSDCKCNAEDFGFGRWGGVLGRLGMGQKISEINNFLTILHYKPPKNISNSPLPIPNPKSKQSQTPNSPSPSTSADTSFPSYCSPYGSPHSSCRSSVGRTRPTRRTRRGCRDDLGNVDCGMWKIWNVENVECGKYGMWIVDGG